MKGTPISQDSHMPERIFVLPGLFDSADAAAIAHERRFLLATGVRLGLAVLAAILAALAILHHHEGLNYFGLGAAGAFTGALIAEVWLISAEPENHWFENRAIAESVKTLSWRFAVGGLPYPLSSGDCIESLADDLENLVREAHHLGPIATIGSAVTSEMTQLRSAELGARRDAFANLRVADQQKWYFAKARKIGYRAGAWRFVLIAVEIAGVLAGVATGFGYLHFDLTSIVSTALGSAVAWLAVKQHDSLSRSYASTSHELALLTSRNRLHLVQAEDEWARTVQNVEDLLAQEHSSWRAARLIF